MKYFLNRIRALSRYLGLSRNLGLAFFFSFLRREEKTALIFSKRVTYTNRFWFLHGIEEIFIENVYLFKSNCEKPYIIDCGSNIGLSVIFFKRLYPAATVVAFEPDPINCALLTKNIASFGFSDVVIHSAAVWSSDTKLKFTAFQNVGSKLVSGDDVNGEEIIEVEALALSPYLTRKIDFLKIDIEGAELEVLRSCGDVLTNVANIFIEYHSSPNQPQQLDKLLSILTAAGFRYYIRQAWEQFKYPYVERKTPMFDLQLNIFGYRD